MFRECYGRYVLFSYNQYFSNATSSNRYVGEYRQFGWNPCTQTILLFPEAYVPAMIG